jgi:uncharacterized oxidoreductase
MLSKTLAFGLVGGCVLWRRRCAAATSASAAAAAAAAAAADDTVIFDATKLNGFVRELLGGAGCGARERQLVADHLVQANLMGHDSHGVQMLPQYFAAVREGRLLPNVRPTRLVAPGGGGAAGDGPILSFDARGSFGQSSCHEAVGAAIVCARAHGVCLLTVRDAHHIGRVGAYAEQAAAAGLVFISFVNTTGHAPLVAPYGGTTAVCGTNPFTCAVPQGLAAAVAAEEEAGAGAAAAAAAASPPPPPPPPLVLDVATSTLANGKVMNAMYKGAAVPEGVLLDADGSPSVDPGCMWKSKEGQGVQYQGGCIRAFGLHKGSGLMLMAELLAGALTGARPEGGGTIHPKNARRGATTNNLLAVLFDPLALGIHADGGGAEGSAAAAEEEEGVATTRAPTATRAAAAAGVDEEVTAFVEHFKAARPVAGGGGVLVPGEVERRSMRRREREGVPVPAKTWQQMLEAADSVGLDWQQMDARARS